VTQSLDAIEEICLMGGAGAWQINGLLKVAEMRGKILKLFTERIEFDIDEKLIARLEAGRRNAGLNPPQLAAKTDATAEVETESEIPDPEKGTVQ
jgi:hypothetical protein